MVVVLWDVCTSKNNVGGATLGKKGHWLLTTSITWNQIGQMMDLSAASHSLGIRCRDRTLAWENIHHGGHTRADKTLSSILGAPRRTTALRASLGGCLTRGPSKLSICHGLFCSLRWGVRCMDCATSKFITKKLA